MVPAKARWWWETPKCTVGATTRGTSLGRAGPGGAGHVGHHGGVHHQGQVGAVLLDRPRGQEHQGPLPEGLPRFVAGHLLQQ